MHRLIELAASACRFVGRCYLACLYMCKLNYSRRLAWAKAAR